MKKLCFLLFATVLMLGVACKEEEPVLTPYELLTTRIWASDSLLANGEDASGPGQMLETFKGNAVFNTDGTGVLGNYNATWTLSVDNTEITIITVDPAMEIITTIVELTKTSLKITTAVADINNPGQFIEIRMTFKGTVKV
ncbi:MAG TPA: hypothetical protein P5228_04455 [Bacteroidales bacterium]|nr:hypothetical protein [Bacteroidales bacterium]HRZ48839.1 hypothetical protein [Bacteroidales bacterium]